MACSVFKYLIFAAFLSQWQNARGTRFQPSIIWDIYNKVISCKCNWMNIPKLDNYDRIELLCPSQILVSSTREHDVAKTRQYYNIFMRKFDKTKHTLDELRESLYNGSFCDPTSNETKKLYQCVRDDPQQSIKLRFHAQEDLLVGDIVVFFCNKGTGLQSDLDSKDAKCEMIFIANVTADERKDYDCSYGKCSLPVSDSNCNNISQNCPCENSPSPSYLNASSKPVCVPKSGLSDAPRNVTVAASTTSSLSISWKEPLNRDDVVAYYAICYRTNTLQACQTKMTEGHVVSAILENLNSSTQYFIRVRAFTCKGPSNYSTEISYKTQEQPATTAEQPKTTIPTTTRISTTGTNAKHSAGTSNDGNFKILPFFVGLITGIAVTVFILIVFICCKKKGKLQFAKNTCKEHELTHKNIESDCVMPSKPLPSTGRSPSIEIS